MEVSLRKADRLARQLRALVDDRKASPLIRLSIFGSYTDAELVARRNEAVKAVNEAAANIEDMINAVYDIRNKLGAANVEHGIHALLTERSRLEMLVKTHPVGALLGDVPSVGAFDASPIQGKLAAMRLRAATPDRYSSRGADEIEVTISFDAPANYKKLLVAINDRLEHLNASNKITLADTTAAALRLFDLI